MKVYALELAQERVRGRILSAEGDPHRRLAIPIGAFLIDHPRARVLVDVGLPARWRLVDRVLSARYHPRPQTLPEQLASHGIDPASVEVLVLTHLHRDHAEAVRAFPRAQVHVGAADLEVAGRHGRWRRLGEARPVLLPAERTCPVRFEGGPAWGPFPHTVDLFGDGTLRLVPTPGHTLGSLSVVVAQPGDPLVMVGDACYLASALRQGSANGTSYGRSHDLDVGLAAVTRARLREVLALYPDARILPAHDPEVWAELPHWPQPLEHNLARRSWSQLFLR